MHLRPAAIPLRSRSAAGFSLVTVLMLVIVLGFLAMGAMNSSIVQERMAGNANDRNVAMQAAEAALKDGEQAILNLPADPVVSANCSAGNGLCTASVTASPPIAPTIDWSSAAATRGYAAPALPNVAEQPRYVIEQLPPMQPEPGMDSAETGAQQAQPYRITARGVGAQANTSVVLQSIYIKP